MWMRHALSDMDLKARVNIELAKATNYLILGNWLNTISYKLSDAGIPVVKVPDGTSLGYSVYALNVASSTIGASPAGSGASQWRLVESAEFIYMQQAYIERLQAAIVTAEKIESLMIRTKNLEVLDDAQIGGFSIENGGLKANFWYQTYIGTILVHVSGDINLSSGGLVVTSRYGGTTEHPQVVSWNTEITSTGLKVGEIEVRRDGIYRNGSKIL